VVVVRSLVRFSVPLARGSDQYMPLFFKVHLARGSYSFMGSLFKVPLARGSDPVGCVGLC